MQDFVVSNGGVNTGGGSFPIPAFHSGVVNVESNITSTIQIQGDYFTPDTIVTINQSHFVINSTVIVNAHLIELNVTLGDFSLIVDRLVDLTIENEGGEITFIDSINIYDAGWFDFRLGGNIFSIGEDASSDVEHSSGVTITRTSEGLTFVNPIDWTNTIKFNVLSFNRGDDATIEFIFTYDGSFLLGVGSDAMDPNDSLQYKQVESGLDFNSGIRGNNGTLGVLASISYPITVSINTWYKLKITKDGGENSTFEVFSLINGDEANWDDESNSVYSVISSLTPDELNLFPIMLTSQHRTSTIKAIRKIII